MNPAALGTAISFAKFIFLPHQKQEDPGKTKIQSSFWAAVILLIGGLILANVVYYEAYTVANIVKPLGTIFLGWLAYFAIFRHTVFKLPRLLEQFNHLIGMMSLMLILLFWVVLARLGATIAAIVGIELAIRGHLSPGGGFAVGVAGGTAISRRQIRNIDCKKQSTFQSILEPDPKSAVFQLR